MNKISIPQDYRILEKTPVVVFDWTSDPNVPSKYVSENVSIYGYQPDDFYEGELSDYWDFLHHEDRNLARETVYEARRLGLNEVRHSYRVICKNKMVKWVEEVVVFEFDEQGNCTTERGILYDITKQKQMEEAIIQSEKKYRSLFEKSPALMLMMDEHGVIKSANNAFLDALGCHKGNVHGIPFSEFLDELSKKYINCHGFIKLVEKHSSIPLELVFLTSQKEALTISLLFHIVEKQGEYYDIQLIGQNITQKKAYEDHIRYLSFHDKLTGLFNRTYFDDYMLQMDLGKSEIYSIIIGDMNGLKESNDLFGHKVGDELLKGMAEVLKQSCRATDIICRIGGDEFSIILPGADEFVARTICGRIREKCEAYDSCIVPMSIALGFSTKNECQKTSDEIVKEADDRMYRNKLTVSKSIRSSMVMSLKASLEEKTMETNEHANRIKHYAMELGKRLELDDNRMDELSLASMFHDIGKIGIPDSILMKAGPLLDEEWQVMKSHCEIGYNILNACSNMSGIAKNILHHHERWDGTGYPLGLKGEEIPQLARIIAIADAYDVMTTNRVYKTAISQNEALKELEKHKEKQFDPHLTDVFIQWIVSSS